MEVLRAAAPGGRLARAVRRLAPPLEEWRRFVYAAGLDPHSAAGRAFGVVDHFPDAPSIAAGFGGDLDLRAKVPPMRAPGGAPLSPEGVTHVPQPRLCRLLRAEFEAAAPSADPDVGGGGGVAYGAEV